MLDLCAADESKTGSFKLQVKRLIKSCLFNFLCCVSKQYNKDLAKVFESIQVDLQGITLLEQAGRDNLINFANTGIGHIDYENYLAEVIS